MEVTKEIQPFAHLEINRATEIENFSVPIKNALTSQKFVISAMTAVMLQTKRDAVSDLL